MSDSQYKKSIGSLAGKYFHSVAADHQTIECQGRFIALASPGVYHVQLFEWLTGSPDDQLLIPATDMRYWRIYDTREEWLAAYERYAREKNVQAVKS